MTKTRPLIHNKRRNRIRIHSEGKEILLVSGGLFVCVITACFHFLGYTWPAWIVACVLSVVYAIMINFFRCPIRMFQGPTTNSVVAPADGRVVVVEEVDEDEYLHSRCLMVSIFMSLTNVHANWIPCDGRILRVEHQKGNFHMAYLPKASTENERSAILISTPKGQRVLVRQIAGAVARRIVTYAEEGQDCYIDDHLGFIKFGSRVDVYLPLDTEILVHPGQATVGDETLIARLKATEQQPHTEKGGDTSNE